MENKSLLLIRFFQERSISSIDIAEEIGISRQQVENLLKGRCAFREKAALAFSEHYGLSPSWLLTGEGEMYGKGTANINDKGERLNTFLQSKGLSKTEAEKLAGLSSGSVSNITTGKIGLSVNYARKLSSALGVSASWLLTGEGEMEVDGWTPPARAPQATGIVTAGTAEETARLRKENAELREEVERQRKQVERLMAVVENLTRGKEE